MGKEQLQMLVEKGWSIRRIAEATGKSATSIRYWLKKYGLKTKIPKFNKGGFSDRNCVSKAYLCLVCGEDNPENFYQRRGRCKTCHNIGQMDRVKKLKTRAVEYKGGKCEMCGYNKNVAAFDFHHIDPREKDLKWNSSRHWKWDRLKKELDKCQLLCCRCHREVHHPEWSGA